MKKGILFLSIVGILSILAFSQGNKAPLKQATSLEVNVNAIKYAGNNLEEEIVVDGKDIVVSGNENRLTFKGTVGKIVITGKNNDVLIESVKLIVVPGDGNFVSWEKSPNTNGKAVVVDKGGYNNIERKSNDAQDRSNN